MSQPAGNESTEFKTRYNYRVFDLVILAIGIGFGYYQIIILNKKYTHPKIEAFLLKKGYN